MILSEWREKAAIQRRFIIKSPEKCKIIQTKTSVSNDRVMCKQYNPYFPKDCPFGEDCNYIHFTKEFYVDYCQQMNDKNKPSSVANNNYNYYCTLKKKKEYKKGLPILKKLIEKYPFNEQYHASIANCYRKLKDKNAGYHYRKLIGISPNNPLYHVNYAKYLFYLHRS